MSTSMATTSLAAYRTLPVTDRERIVLDVIEAFGERGCIYDEVQAALPHLPNSVSGRFLSLERKGQMFRNGDTRPGKTGNEQQVMRHMKYASKFSIKPVSPFPVKLNPYVKGLAAGAIILRDAKTLEEAQKAMALEIRKARRA